MRPFKFLSILAASLTLIGLLWTVGDPQTTRTFQAQELPLRISSAGPHAVGGAVNAGFQFEAKGTYSPTAGATGIGLGYTSTINVPASQIGIGVYLSPTLVEAGSGTHAELIGLEVAPVITAGAAASTAITALSIPSMTVPAGTSQAVGLYIDAPTGATNDYAVLVNTGRVLIGSVGPHAIGGSIVDRFQLLLTGSFTQGGSVGQAAGLAITSSISPDPNEDAAVFLQGGTLVEAASGTHGVFAGSKFQQPVITAGAGFVTNAATVYVVNAPTGATNNYAIFSDAGVNRFDGDGTRVFELPADATDPTGGGGAAIGRIPVFIGGVTRYLAYY